MAYRKPCIGVTSHAYDETDCFETGGVDTRVDYYLEWIENEMTSRCTAETRAWCDTPGIVTPEYYESLEEDSKLACSNVDISTLSLWFAPLILLIPLSRKKKHSPIS